MREEKNSRIQIFKKTTEKNTAKKIKNLIQGKKQQNNIKKA